MEDSLIEIPVRHSFNQEKEKDCDINFLFDDSLIWLLNSNDKLLLFFARLMDIYMNMFVNPFIIV